MSLHRHSVGRISGHFYLLAQLYLNLGPPQRQPYCDQGDPTSPTLLANSESWLSVDNFSKFQISSKRRLGESNSHSEPKNPRSQHYVEIPSGSIEASAIFADRVVIIISLKISEKLLTCILPSSFPPYMTQNKTLFTLP